MSEPTKILDQISKRDLLFGAHFLLSRKYGKRPLWQLVGDVSGLRAPLAVVLCGELGWNPHNPSSQPLPAVE